ncbi:hypothetical protein N9D99_02235 [Gammaproteobacteria bacterium]|nr:hypothetical protein [Gammaproteobacteria bacterium]MDB2444459.1 hypothetical protein [Gammaproteobacteria bacterium]
MLELSQRERLMISVALIFGGVLIFTRGYPAVLTFYETRNEAIQSVVFDIADEERLYERENYWSDARNVAEGNSNEFSLQIFSGETLATIEASIQSEIVKHARSSGIIINSTRLAESFQSRDWQMVKQELSFRTLDANNSIEFLRKLETSSPRLRVIGFSFNKNNNQYVGSITVVGFARTIVSDSSAERSPLN